MIERPKTSLPGGSRIRPSGGYRDLRSFQVATLIYDATASFCDRFIDMVQAARSGRQNIAEGSRAAAASSQTELRLISVARASLDELLLDYEDYLRQRRLEQWPKDYPKAQAVRRLGQAQRGDRSDRSDPTDQAQPFGAYTPWLTHAEPAVVANTVICLIHQANYLLDRQLTALERGFVEGGGYSEQLAAARIAHRAEKHPAAADKSGAPVCPKCARPMALRTARKGPNAGSQFWGCSGYPECKATRPLDSDNP